MKAKFQKWSYQHSISNTLPPENGHVSRLGWGRRDPFSLSSSLTQLWGWIWSVSDVELLLDGWPTTRRCREGRAPKVFNYGWLLIPASNLDTGGQKDHRHKPNLFGPAMTTLTGVAFLLQHCCVIFPLPNGIPSWLPSAGDEDTMNGREDPFLRDVVFMLCS